MSRLVFDCINSLHPECLHWVDGRSPSRGNKSSDRRSACQSYDRTRHDHGIHAAVILNLSYEIWKEDLNCDPAVLGSTFWLNTKPVTVVGIALYGDRLTSAPPDFYLPIQSMPELFGASSVNDPDTACEGQGISSLLNASLFGSVGVVGQILLRALSHNAGFQPARCRVEGTVRHALARRYTVGE